MKDNNHNETDDVSYDVVQALREETLAEDCMECDPHFAQLLAWDIVEQSAMKQDSLDFMEKDRIDVGIGIVLEDEDQVDAEAPSEDHVVTCTEDRVEADFFLVSEPVLGDIEDEEPENEVIEPDTYTAMCVLCGVYAEKHDLDAKDRMCVDEESCLRRYRERVGSWRTEPINGRDAEEALEMVYNGPKCECCGKCPCGMGPYAGL